jgi:hypothetical protein
VTVDKDAEINKTKGMARAAKKTPKTNGACCLRSGRKELSEQQIWDIYTILTDSEDVFRSMESELDLRPIYHQTDRSP